MLGFLKDHSGAFDPDEVRILVAAFEKAWASVQTSGAIFETDGKAAAARAILAKHIVSGVLRCSD
jgi:hypothetical protein